MKEGPWLVIEEHLKSIHPIYKLSVECRRIGPVAIEQVKPGTIEEVKRILKQRSAVGEPSSKK